MTTTEGVRRVQERILYLPNNHWQYGKERLAISPVGTMLEDAWSTVYNHKGMPKHEYISNGQSSFASMSIS